MFDKCLRHLNGGLRPLAPAAQNRLLETTTAGNLPPPRHYFTLKYSSTILHSISPRKPHEPSRMHTLTPIRKGMQHYLRLPCNTILQHSHVHPYGGGGGGGKGDGGGGEDAAVQLCLLQHSSVVHPLATWWVPDGQLFPPTPPTCQQLGEVATKVWVLWGHID